MRALLEVAVFNEESAALALEMGAGRLELCSDYEVGGISPSLELVKRVRSFCQVPLNVIVRPRSGHFYYSSEELKKMTRFMQDCLKLAVDGFVFGALTKEDEIDQKVCEVLLAEAAAKPCTFHRAFDLVGNKIKGMEMLIQLGFSKVLTSGGEASAIEGLKVLTDLQKQFGNLITLMPGGGIRSEHLRVLMTSGCVEYHTAACTQIPGVADRTELLNLQNILQ